MATQMTQMTQATQPTQAQVQGPTTYTISGVKVEFPTRAYPSQIAMMNKVIQGLKQKKNCLLESPTGSGKTLALLCAALAWQRHEHCRVAEINAEIDARDVVRQNQASSGPGRQQEGLPKNVSKDNFPEATDPTKSSYFPSSTEPIYELTDDEDQDFKSLKRPTSAGSEASTSSSTQALNTAKARPTSAKNDQPYFVPPEKKLTVPKIFFGTRTHKQIAQITRELRKTYYKTVRSVILASRDHTCINPMLEGVPNKNENCRDLLDQAAMGGEGCLYHPNARKFGNYNTLEQYNVFPGYDLEDLVKAGKQAKACPYYGTRFLMASADIIFCPYNYIIDPNIRKSMNLDLENQVIIFDEAHNMEDAAREAASFTLKQHEVIRAMQDCEKVKNIGGSEPYCLGEIAKLLSSFSLWIDAQSEKLKDISYNTSGKFWTGTEVVASLETAGMDEQCIKQCEIFVMAVLQQREKENEMTRERGFRSNEKPSITSATIKTVEDVFRLFQDMYKDNGRNRDDFRVAMIKSIEKRRRDEHKGPMMSLVTFTINVWCLNPAVSFTNIREAVHSIVLTSGTLSPMNSFQSELGTPFPFKLEASHVIDPNQVWAGVLGTGPNGINLNGSYQNTESFGYQDEVGAVIQYVCDTIPHGVLCFFPSYRMLDKMIERWNITRRYQSMEVKKHIVIEPRSGAADFESAINEFSCAINRSNFQSRKSDKTGALFFAVCRGKVSEGLDFSDNNARAVICIGIPFPNFMDMQVKLKREYNNLNISKGLLNGSEWYEIQAFRALNQALGRCIRHRNDWGAILLIDDRFVKSPRYVQYLSKWIRSSVQNFESFMPICGSLENFKEEMLARPPPVETAFCSLPEKFLQNSNEESSSTFGMNSNSENEGPKSFDPCAPVSMDTDDSSHDDSDFIPNAKLNRPRFHNPTGSNMSNGSFNVQPPSTAIKPRGKQLQTSTPTNNSIAALFARQREKESSTPQEPDADSGISVEPTKAKRNWKKIKL